MEQYISKSALVAEIEKLIDEIYAGRPFDSLSSEQQTALWYVKSIMSSINTLEVKEVDLDGISRHYALNNSPWDECRDEIQDAYKAGFELGLKATQKGE